MFDIDTIPPAVNRHLPLPGDELSAELGDVQLGNIVGISRQNVGSYVFPESAESLVLSNAPFVSHLPLENWEKCLQGNYPREMPIAVSYTHLTLPTKRIV